MNKSLNTIFGILILFFTTIHAQVDMIGLQEDVSILELNKPVLESLVVSPPAGGRALDIDNDGFAAACDCDDNNALVGRIQGLVRYVDPLGSDNANNCLDENIPCETIAHAINEASSGDTLVLAAGTFNEAGLVVDKDLFIIGEGPLNTIIDGQSLDSVFFSLTNVDVTFCGLTIAHGLGSGPFGGGINILVGQLTITNSIIRDNKANVGGGIRADSNAQIIITNTTLSNNEAHTGGAIQQVGGSLSITNSTLSNNKALSLGGAIQSTTHETRITNTTLSDNEAEMGGGIFLLGGNTIITNSTLSSNQADLRGGGIFVSVGIVSIANSTLSGNSANTNGGGVFGLGHLVTTSHTLFAGNAPQDCSHTVISNGYNLESTTSCGFNQTGDLQNANADLLPLADNGGPGPTMTHALGDASDAIDAGNTTCGVSTDQRRAERPVDAIGFPPDGIAHCDIGAFEKQP